MRILTSILLLFTGLVDAAARAPLTFVRAIALPNVEGRIDHLALDASSGRLFVAALGNNSVEVLDVKDGTHLKSVRGFREPQGIGFAVDANSLVVANGQGEGVQIVSANDYQLTHTTRLGGDSDNVRYDARAKRIYVGYGDGALAGIAPESWRVVGTVALPGHPESFQLERAGPRIFVNVPTAQQIAVVDRDVLKVVATWPVRGALANYPMALDETHQRVFCGLPEARRGPGL
jgi:DNA-binding beta-propeller fold protein YncE